MEDSTESSRMHNIFKQVHEYWAIVVNHGKWRTEDGDYDLDNLLISFMSYFNRSDDETGFNEKDCSFQPKELLKEDLLWMLRAYDLAEDIVKLYKKDYIKSKLASKVLDTIIGLLIYITNKSYDAWLIANDKIIEVEKGGAIYIFDDGSIAGYNKYIFHRKDQIFKWFRWNLVEGTDLPKWTKNHASVLILSNIIDIEPKISTKIKNFINENIDMSDGESLKLDYKTSVKNSRENEVREESEESKFIDNSLISIHQMIPGEERSITFEAEEVNFTYLIQQDEEPEKYRTRGYKIMINIKRPESK